MAKTRSSIYCCLYLDVPVTPSHSFIILKSQEKNWYETCLTGSKTAMRLLQKYPILPSLSKTLPSLSKRYLFLRWPLDKARVLNTRWMIDSWLELPSHVGNNTENPIHRQRWSSVTYFSILENLWLWMTYLDIGVADMALPLCPSRHRPCHHFGEEERSRNECVCGFLRHRLLNTVTSCSSLSILHPLRKKNAKEMITIPMFPAVKQF